MWLPRRVGVDDSETAVHVRTASDDRKTVLHLWATIATNMRKTFILRRA